MNAEVSESLLYDDETSWHQFHPNGWHEAERSGYHQVMHMRDSWETLVDSRPRTRRAPAFVLFVVPQASEDNGALSTIDNVRHQILELMREEDPTARPTTYAQNIAWPLISTVSKHLGANFPLGFVMEDEQGGIRVEWENQAKHVRLAIPGTSGGRQYIYHQQGDAYGTEEVSAPALEGWLFWLAST